MNMAIDVSISGRATLFPAYSIFYTGLWLVKAIYEKVKTTQQNLPPADNHLTCSIFRILEQTSVQKCGCECAHLNSRSLTS